jgi:predicted negative regulator of RcsB-dependent stress response
MSTDNTKHINEKIFKDSVDDLDRFEDFFQSNLKKIITSAVLIVIIISIALIAWNIIKQAQFKADAALASATTIEELKTAIAKYPDSKGTTIAQLNLATAYFNKEKYSDAMSVLENLAGNAAEASIKGRALLNSAYCLSAMNKSKEAAEKLKLTGSDDSMPEYIRNEANLEAGRIYFNLNETEKAKAILNLINAENQNKFWAKRAKGILRSIDANLLPTEKALSANKKTTKPAVSKKK